jgi:Tol biopolymer transport system component
VAFLSGRDLYVLLPGDNAEPRKLASGDIADRQRIGWYPDGTALGFITYDLETIGSEQAWSVRVDGGEPTLITTILHKALGRGPTFERAVEWSPDGKWVMISSAANPFRLLRWPLATSRDDDIRDIPGGEPEWSPESRTIIYTEALNGALALYDVLKNEEGEPYRNEAALVGTGLGEYAQGPLPLWSPASKGADSDLIAYRSRTNESVPRVALRRRGGRELTPLDPLTNNPAWSPAGDRLVFETGEMKTAPLGMEWTPTGLAIATIDPEGEHTVSPLVQDAKWPAWGR